MGGADTSTTPSTAPLAAATVDLRKPVVLRRVATLVSPIAMAAIGDTGDLLIAQRGGVIRRAKADESAELTVAEEPVLDLSEEVADTSGERGLLGIAVDAAATMLIVSFTDGGDDGASVIRRYPIVDGLVDGKAGRELLRLEQPFSNHNGGNVTFGPDGMLYIGFGDGGGQGDPNSNGQDPSTLLGSLLRIDVSGSTDSDPYRIPSDNPFINLEGARQEIWLFGVRNPWRFSFDSASGDLWIGDVGGSARDGSGRGRNLGWAVREGFEDTDHKAAAATDRTPPTDPLITYSHSEGVSVTGGVVVRDPRLATLTGVYLYGDFGRSELRAVVLSPTGSAVKATVDTGTTALEQLVSFGTDAQHRVYLLSLTGSIFRIEPAE
jgi:glucose/arabinose dehydrogenase